MFKGKSANPRKFQPSKYSGYTVYDWLISSIACGNVQHTYHIAGNFRRYIVLEVSEILFTFQNFISEKPTPK